jgi:Flp pilus assembly protein TadD
MMTLKHAVAAHRAGRLGDAEAAYRMVLRDEPDNADAAHLLGLVLHQRGRNGAAVVAIEHAVALNPRASNYHNSHGLTLHAQGQFEAAEEALQIALSLDPSDADAHNNLGLVYSSQRRFALAATSLERALEIRPQYPAALNNYGRALVALGRASEATAALKTACALEPANASFANTLGVAFRESGQYGEAQRAYKHALSMDPRNVDAHVSYAQLLLSMEDYTAGWAEHEWRLARPEHQNRPHASRWDGKSSLDGKTILLWAEQGLGDAIQFVRYAEDAAIRGARVVVECAPPLHRLFATAPGVAAVVAPGDAVSFDVHCPLMSLAGIFDKSLTAQNGPYLSAPAAMPLEDGAAMKVGLVWAGNPRHSNDVNRSAALSDFTALTALGQDVSFYGLQKGAASDQTPPTGMNFTTLGPELDDFQDTASALIALDLLITVDTSVAHLAGALGRPVWLLLPFVPDWRWLQDRDDSPWYRSMRLFRQGEGENWLTILERVADTLRNKVEIRIQNTVRSTE